MNFKVNSICYKFFAFYLLKFEYLILPVLFPIVDLISRGLFSKLTLLIRKLTLDASILTLSPLKLTLATSKLVVDGG